MVNTATRSASSTPPPSASRNMQEDVLRSGLRVESTPSNNNVTFEEGESPVTNNTLKHRLELEQELLSGVEGLEPQDVLNSVGPLGHEDGQYGEVDGLLLDGVVPATPTMHIIMETTSSVAATGPESTSSHRSILSNYSGSSSENELEDEDGVRENGNELAGSSSQISTGGTSVPSSLPNRAQRVQAQLVHQRRLQNTAKVSPSMNSHVIVGKEELQGLMENVTTRIDKSFQDIMMQQRKDFDRVFHQIQSESQKHTTIESRLHAQLLLQSESMVAMELKLLRLEAKIQQKDQTRSRLRLYPVIETHHRDEDEEGLSLDEDDEPARTTHVLSSGASLVSAVTATSGLEDGALDEEEEPSAHSFEAPPIPETDAHSNSTAPSNVLLSRQFSDSILLNPILVQSSHVSVTGESTRAIRPSPVDDASSLATSVTTSTLPSTVVTASNPNAARTTLHRGRSSEMEVYLRGNSGNAPRSRSQSPLTVPSMATASIVPSLAASVLTTNAVASSRDFRARRIPSMSSSQSESTRPITLTNRVVSFVADAPQAANDNIDTGSMADTLTLPDEIDNMSDIVDAFAASSNRWREEYEARLDTIQKRFTRD